MNLHVSTPLAAESARRSREFREKIEATHRYKVMKGIDPSPYWAGMWMWDLVTMAPKERRTSLDSIVSAVCDYYQLTKPELFGSTRYANAVRARHVAFYLARKCTRLSSSFVGKKCYRDHSVVLYAQRKIAEQMKTDDALTREVRDLMGRLA